MFQDSNELLVAMMVLMGSIFASSGFWMFVMKRTERTSAANRILIGMAHQKIIELGSKYVDRGQITTDEYDDLLYIYVPYRDLNGNGTAEKVMEDCKRIKMVDGRYIKGGSHETTH